jgi:1-pyrroline-5-carboxylate dehydrogenase
MSLGHYSLPVPANEPVLNYAPGSPERARLKATLKELKGQTIEVPMTIGGEAVQSGDVHEMRPPHERAHLLGTYHACRTEDVQRAVDAALAAKAGWAATTWENRAAIFLKAAELIATKYRPFMNGTTMLGQSKNVYQAEIDAACEFADFLRFNVHFLSQIYQQQPLNAPGMHNRLEYRPLEGFVLAVSPFNFTAIGGNIPAAPALCGNTVVWKPAGTQVYSAQMTMRIFEEAGLPPGVINMIPGEGPIVGDVCFAHPEFAGVHFTGSTSVFNHMWKMVGENMHRYRGYPRLVGETGGKDFVLAHPSADVDAVVTGLLRGAFEYQGQKCSAASRAYIPSNMADEVRERLVEGVRSFKIGSVEEFSNFVNAVIDERSYNKIAGYLDHAKAEASILVGGDHDKSEGYFVQPTVIETENASYRTMCEEIFGPVLTLHVYDADRFDDVLTTVDQTSPYALTGAIFSQDRAAVQLATDRLRNAAGNFYVNDKPTGAVVGQQPFGGARASGTNDKAGSALNLYRWLSPRTIKETFNPPTDYRYPFMAEA